jgi:hypothetical protein
MPGFIRAVIKEVGFWSGECNIVQDNFGLRPSGPRVGPGKILKFRPVQTLRSCSASRRARALVILKTQKKGPEIHREASSSVRVCVLRKESG